MANRREFTVLAWLKGRDDQSKAVQSAESSWSSLTTFLKSSFVITAGDVANAIRGVVNTMGEWIEVGAAQEASVIGLVAALEGRGIPGVDKWSEAIQRNNAQLEAQTKFGDEALNAVSALLLDLGTAPERINAATLASANLAAAFESVGVGVDAAARLLGKTRGGLAGELAELVPAVRELTKEQLINGDAVALVNDLYEGRAIKATEGYAGRVAQLGNAWGSVQEAVALAIIANDDVIDSMQDATGVLRDNTEAIGTLSSAIVTTLVGGLSLAAQGFERLVEAGAFVREFFGTDMADALETTEVSSTALRVTARRLGITVAELQQQMERGAIATHGLNVAAAGASPTVAKLATDVAAAADAAGDLAASSDEAAQAARVLGEVTSQQLEGQVVDLTAALLLQRDALGANSREYLRLEEVASEKIDALRERIESLRDGNGDLTESVRDAATAFEDYGDELETVETRLDRATGATERNTAANAEAQRQAEAAARRAIGTANAGEDEFILGQGLGGRPLFENLAPRARVTRSGRLRF